jgi:hypothetical protein
MPGKYTVSSSILWLLASRPLRGFNKKSENSSLSGDAGDSDLEAGALARALVPWFRIPYRISHVAMHQKKRTNTLGNFEKYTERIMSVFRCKTKKSYGATPRTLTNSGILNTSQSKEAGFSGL